MQINMRRLEGVGMSQEVREARQGCIGGSDARIIMSGDQQAIERLWKEKRGEKVAKDLSEVLLVQMGNVTENLNLAVFEGQTGLFVTGEQSRPAYEEWPVAQSTLDGLAFNSEADFLAGVSALAIVEAKFAMPFRWSLQTSIEKHYAQVQHNMMVTGMPRGWLSVVTGAAQYAKVEIEADFFYQMAMLEAEQEFWRCVQTGRRPGAPEIDVPVLEMREEPVDMSTSNAWTSLAIDLCETKSAVAKHEKAKKEIKELMPPDAKVAFGRGVKISKASNGRMTVTIDEEAA